MKNRIEQKVMIFLLNLLKILNKYKDWKAIVIGDENGKIKLNIKMLKYLVLENTMK